MCNVKDKLEDSKDVLEIKDNVTKMKNALMGLSVNCQGQEKNQLA